jgi:diguanylate cyclase (GGDEF)-like protein
MPYPDGLVRRLPDQLIRISRWPSMVVFVWLMTAAFVAVLLGAAWYAHHRSEVQLQEQVAAIASLAADRAAMSFDVVDGLLLSVIDDVDLAELDGPALISGDRRAAMQDMLTHHQLRVAGVAALTLANAAGYRLASSPADSREPRIAPLEYYRALAGSSRHASLVWTVNGPADGLPKIFMARRIEHADGRLAGAVVAEMDLADSIGDFRRSLSFGTGDFIALRDKENELLAGHQSAGAPLEAIGVDIVSQAIARGSQEGISQGVATLDGGTRMIGYRKLPRYPLYIVYGKDVAAMLSLWKYELAGVLLAALLAIAVSAMVSIGIRRHVLVANQLETVRAHLKESNHALRAALAATELMAAKDQLTGLWNRRTFDQRLKESAAHQERHEGTFSLLLIDIDHFKRINDRYGHMAGDEVLRRFGEVLRERLRQNDVAARWGGEEFAVLADMASLENGQLLAEQIRQAVATTDFPGADHVTVSIGVAEYFPGESEDDLLQRADQVLYEAKRRGRNCVVASEAPDK